MSEKIVDYPAPRTSQTSISPKYEVRSEPDAFSYPGPRPETAFCASGEDLLRLDVAEVNDSLSVSILNDSGEKEDLDKYLKSNGVAPLAERIAIVGFGSNANPSQLITKFAEADSAGDRTIVPTLRGKIKDAAPGYVPRVSIFGGYIPADLVYTLGAVTDVAINLLSDEQFRLMNESEATSYRLCRYGEVTIDGTDLAIPAYIYVAEEGALVNENGEPILIEGITEVAGQGVTMNQKQVLEFIARQIGADLSCYDPNFEPEYIKGDDAKQLKWYFKQNSPAGMFTAEQIVSNTLYGWVMNRQINEDRGFLDRYAIRNAINELLQRKGLASQDWSLLKRIDPKDSDYRNKPIKKLGDFIKIN